ncbi:TPA: hypothetical protein QDZ84_003507 [Shewanella algae]|uniref:hypothetical protein n=1 Tax=Shewanella TaxID=22 RepID=UPI00142FA6E1|nr:MULTISPECIES: hypothetical protein [Shewanella]NJI86974.1 hypothetical protein [Shewanella sp. Iso12]HDS1208468.1 hypothetical protein [Shewanella algae]
MSVKRLICSVTPLLFFISLSLNAKDDAALTNSKLTKSEQDYAALWELTDEEYLKFKKILQSPRAYISPDLEKNPIVALGLEAESSAERQRYADRWVQMRYKANIGSLSWDLEVSEAWQRNYPGVPRFATKDSLYREAAASAYLDTYRDTGPRAQIYLKAVGCDSCISLFNEHYGTLKSGKISGIDLFFIGGESNSDIALWANKRNIRLEDVNQSRVVTLSKGTGDLSKVPYIKWELQ